MFKEGEFKLNIVNLSVLLLIISTFFLSTFVRGILMNDSFRGINFIAIITILSIFLMTHLNKKLSIYTLFNLLLLTILSLLFFNSELRSYNHGSLMIVFFFNIIFPLILVTVEFQKDMLLKKIKIVMKTFNLFICILLIIGVIDFFTDKLIGRLLVPIFNDIIYTSFIESPEQRYVSFVGHPLLNNQLFLMYYIMNNLYNKYILKKDKNFFLLTLVTMIGVGLTGSKTGMVILVVSTLVFGYQKFSNLILLSIASVTALTTGIFSVTIERFTSTTLTTGRAEIWETIVKADYFPFKIFSGYGSNFVYDVYNTVIKYASAGFEYPYKGFSLNYGILFCVIFYIITFIMPASILLKRKQYHILISYSLIFLVVNTYNGIMIVNNNMLILAVLIMFVMNLSSYAYDKRKIDYISKISI